MNKMILAEDKENLMKIYKRVLENFGKNYNFETDFVQNGKELVKKVEENPGLYSLIITDKDMPEMDGLEAIKKIRERDKEVPIFLISGSLDIMLSEKAREIGANGFYEKPFNLNDLELLIIQYIK